MQRETHLLSELDMEEPGLVMHFLKHLSVTFCRSSCMLASATCCCTCWMISCCCWGDKFFRASGSILSVFNE